MYSVDEQTDRCPESLPDPAYVGADEILARVLHSGITNDEQKVDFQTFRTDELSPGKAIASGIVTDVACGCSAGISLQRCPPVSDEQLDAMSAMLAAPSRIPQGAAKASAADLRNIKVNNTRAVYLLPDGSKDDPAHCVMRVDPSLAKQFVKEARKKIVDLFRGSACQELT